MHVTEARRPLRAIILALAVVVGVGPLAGLPAQASHGGPHLVGAAEPADGWFGSGEIQDLSATYSQTLTSGNIQVRDGADNLILAGGSVAGNTVSFDVTGAGLADGNYTATANVSSSGGSSSDSWSFAIDTVAPDPAVIVSPEGSDVVSDDPPSAVVDGESGATINVYDGALNLIGSGVAASPTAIELSIGPDAEPTPYSIDAEVVDPAGNSSGLTGTPVSFTLDNAADAPAITTPTDGTKTSLEEITVDGTTNGLEGDGTVEIFDGETSLGTLDATGGAFSGMVTLDGEGSHALTAQFTDGAGNVSELSDPAIEVIVDLTAPAVPAFEVAPTILNVANCVTPGTCLIDVSGVADRDTALEVSIDDNDLDDTDVVTAPGLSNAAGEFAIAGVEVGSLDDGDLTVTVTAFDDATPANEASSSVDIVKDTVAPGAVDFAGDENTDGLADEAVNLANETGYLVGGAPADVPANEDVVVANVSVSDGVDAVEAEVPLASPFEVALDLSGLADTWDAETEGLAGLGAPGTLVADVVLVDDVGNESAASSLDIEKDTIAPGAASITSPADGDVLTSMPTSVSGDAGFDSAVEVLDGEDVVGTDDADGAGAYTAIDIELSGEGFHHLASRQTDAAGNAGSDVTVPSVGVLVDLLDPSLVSVSPDGLGSNVTSIAATFDEPMGAGSISVEDGLGNFLLGSTSVDGNDVVWTSAGGSLTEAGNPYEVSITATDLNASPTTPDATILLELIVDNTAPDAPEIASPGDGAILDACSFSVDGTAEPGSTVTVSEGGSALASAAADAEGAYSVPVTVDEGAHALDVTSTDPAGNASSAAALSVTCDETAPTASASGSDLGVLSGTVAVNAADNLGVSSILVEWSNAAATGSETIDCGGATACGGSVNVTGVGPTDVTVTATDLAGHTGTASHSFVLLVNP